MNTFYQSLLEAQKYLSELTSISNQQYKTNKKYASLYYSINNPMYVVFIFIAMIILEFITKGHGLYYYIGYTPIGWVLGIIFNLLKLLHVPLIIIALLILAGVPFALYIVTRITFTYIYREELSSLRTSAMETEKRLKVMQSQMNSKLGFLKREFQSLDMINYMIQLIRTGQAESQADALKQAENRYYSEKYHNLQMAELKKQTELSKEIKDISTQNLFVSLANHRELKKVNRNMITLNNNICTAADIINSNLRNIGYIIPKL